jgi:hypothetical protein
MQPRKSPNFCPDDGRGLAFFGSLKTRGSLHNVSKFSFTLGFSMRTASKEVEMKRPERETKEPVPRTPEMEDAIRKRAYELFELRGRADGFDVDDWTQAEAEMLRSKQVAKASSVMANRGAPLSASLMSS